MIGHVAAATKTIRVGSGGAMLPNHAPLVVAEQFGTLEALYPGRIDLGLGPRSGGRFSDNASAATGFAARRGRFSGAARGTADIPGAGEAGQVVKAIPGQGSKVPITLLGSSDFSAELAGMLGLPFAFAAHFAPEYLYVATQLYCEQFRPSEVLREAVPDGRGAGDCGGDGCSSPAVVHHLPAALLRRPQPAGGIADPGGLHGAAMAGLGAGSCREQTGRGDRGIRCDGKGGAGEVGA